MAAAQIKPYSEISEETFPGKVTLQIRSSDILHYPDFDKPVYQFSQCLFEAVEIQNKDGFSSNDIKIVFIDCYIKDISIHSLQTDRLNISFVRCLVIKCIFHHNRLKGLTFRNSVALNVDVNGAGFVDFSFMTDDIGHIGWTHLLRELNIYKSFLVMLKEKQIYSIANVEEIKIKGSKSSDSATGVIKTYIENGLYSYEKYRLSDEEIAGLNINFSIQYTNDTAGKSTIIRDIHFRSLNLKGRPAGNIRLEDCKIGHLLLDALHPRSDLIFYYVAAPTEFPLMDLDETETPTKLEIRNSTLDTTWFDNFDFDSYQNISFYRTKFSKTIFSACNFPTDYSKFKSLEDIHYPDKRRDNYHKDMYEIFLQLRKALENTGNFHESINLHSVSNDALKEIRGLSKWDKVILWVNRYSNNHGISIKSAIVGFLVSSVFIYLLYLLSLGRLFNNQAFDVNLVGYYFAFIDITHRTDFLTTKENFGIFTLFIDFIGKVLVGFYIYQFVAAFRKYGRK